MYLCKMSAFYMPVPSYYEHRDANYSDIDTAALNQQYCAYNFQDGAYNLLKGCGPFLFVEADISVLFIHC